MEAIVGPGHSMVNSRHEHCPLFVVRLANGASLERPLQSAGAGVGLSNSCTAPSSPLAKVDGDDGRHR